MVAYYMNYQNGLSDDLCSYDCNRDVKVTEFLVKLLKMNLYHKYIFFF